MALPALPLAKWERTKETLDLWVQIVGKVRLADSLRHTGGTSGWT